MADNLTEAKHIAADAQGVDPADAQSFGYLSVIPTAKKIAKTKSLLRGI